MNPKYLDDVLDQLEVEFPGFIPAPRESNRTLVYRRIFHTEAEDDALRAAAKTIHKTWTGRRSPGVRDLVQCIEREQAWRRENERTVAIYARVKELRSRYSDAMLSMSARPSAKVCSSCAADVVPRGIQIADDALKHEHFTLRELDADPALEIAITQARAAVPNPLESRCRPRSLEASASFGRVVKQLGSSIRVVAS